MTRRPPPVAVLSAAFLSLLLVLSVIFHRRLPDGWLLSLRYAGAMAVIGLYYRIAAARPGNAAFKVMDILMPVFIVMFTFDSLSRLTQYVNPGDRDAALAGLDLAIFGVHPGIWAERVVRPSLTTALQLCYTSYYFLPVALGAVIFFQNPREEFDLVVFGIVLGFFVSYVGYLLVPALGPRTYLNGAFHADLMRGPLANAINNTLNILEGENRDAFPSGHTELVLIVLYYAWRFKRWFFWVALLPVAGLVLSTVYLRYHYAVDVVAGIVLAPVCVWLAGRMFRTYRGEAGGIS